MKLLLASENGMQSPANEKTAESILWSLSKVEGSLLSNHLLIPEKVDIDGNTTTKIDPMEEWNKIGGLIDVKEAPLDLVVPLMTSPKQNQKMGLMTYDHILLGYFSMVLLAVARHF
jgi:SpoVK/Ycf46/Vps4 family AAA+-type ATPase